MEEKYAKVKKPKKALIIALSVLLGLFVILAAYIGIGRLIADTLIYSYVNVSDIYYDGREYNEKPERREDYPRQYPFFGNPLIIHGDGGASFGTWFGAGEKYIYVYAAVNDPIYTWIQYLSWRYKNNAVVDYYSVDMDSEYITVNFTGSIRDNDEVIPIGQRFVINIKNASLDNLPTWVNEDEISEGYREFLFYLRNIGTAEPPDWLADSSK